MNIEQLQGRLVELNESGKAIQAKAEAEKRDLTTEDLARIDEINAEFERLEAVRDAGERLAAQESRLSQPAPRKAAPTIPQDTTVIVPRSGMQNTSLSTVGERARWGFRDQGEFYSAVRMAAVNPSQMDQRLIQNALSTYGSEGVGADGGFAVPPEWRSAITSLVAGEESLLSRTDQQTAAGNTITFPVDETTAWQTTGGILTYWDSEASTMTQSKPALKETQIKLHRLTALVPVTEELLEDSSAMGS